MANEAKIVVSAEDRARRILEGVQNSLGQVAQKGESLNAAFARLAPVLGSAFATATFTSFIKSTAHSVDALNDVKDATGSTIENISALEDTAVRTGGTLETVTTSLIKLNQVLGEADPGSDKAKVLQAIGLSAKELRTLDPADALEQVAKALQRFADDGNKARLTQELFGKSLREVAPFLNDLAEKGKANVTVTDAQAKAAEDFNKQLAALDANSQKLARTLLGELLPSLNSVIGSINKYGVLGSIFNALGFDEAYERKKEIAGLSDEVQRLDSYLKKLQADQQGGVGFFGSPEKVAAEIRRVSNELKVAQGTLKGAQDSFKQFTSKQNDENYSNEGRTRPKPTVGLLPVKDTKAKKEQTDGAAQALAAYVQQLEKQLQAEQQLTDIEQARQFLKSLGATGEIDQVRELVFEMAKKVTVAKQDQAITAENIRNAEEQKKQVQALTEQLEEFAGRADEARRAKLTNLFEEQLNSGNFDYTLEEIAKVRKGIASLGKDMEQAGEFAKQAARTIQSELGGNVEQVLDGHFNGILDSWANLLKKMAAQAIAAQLGSKLLGDFDKTGDIGGWAGEAIKWASGFFGSANGNAFDSSGVVTAFARGGVFDTPTAFTFGAGKLGVMGEAGPEAVLPLRRGSDGKLGVVASGAQQAVSFVFNIAAGVSRAELIALIPQLKAQFTAEYDALQRRKAVLVGGS